MIERNRALDWLTHTILIGGVILVGFPIYYAFVAATLPVAEVVKVPMTLIPGDQLLNNVGTAWEQANLGRQLFNSFVMAFSITVGKIAPRCAPEFTDSSIRGVLSIRPAPIPL